MCMAWAELHTPMYADMEYLVRIHEPLEELLVVDRGLVPFHKPKP